MWKILSGFVAGIIFTVLVISQAKSQDVYIQFSEGHCTGTYIGKKFFLTAAHCPKAEKTILIKKSKNDPLAYPAVLRWTDERQDFALIETDVLVEGLVASPISCKYPHEGDKVHVRGYPADLDRLSVDGYIASELQKEVGHWPVGSYPIIMPVYGGMSGAGVYNDKNEVIGVIVGMLIGSSIALMVPTANICDVLPR